MLVFSVLFHALSFTMACLLGYLLLFVNKEKKFSNRFLAILLICFASQHLVLILLASKRILDLPWMMRLFAPLTFVVAPALYLYFRTILYEENHLRKTDYLFFLPAVLAIVNFLPFYLSTHQQKVDALLQYYVQNGEISDPGPGFLPSVWYYGLRTIWSVGLVGISLGILFRFWQRTKQPVKALNSELYRWLLMLGLISLMLALSQIFKALLPTSGILAVNPADLLLGIGVFLICIQLFRHPNLLYGVYLPSSTLATAPELLLSPEKREAELDLAEDEATQWLLTEEQVVFRKKIDDWMETSKPFLQVDYCIDDMAHELGLPRQKLSGLINREFGMGFREYINSYRVAYFKRHAVQPAWDHYTLEAMARSSGFRSRITFIRHFKEVCGITPSAYLKQSKTGRNDL
jgi:AraC-like DNA-binding protein